METTRNSWKTETFNTTTTSRLPSHARLVKVGSGVFQLWDIINCVFLPMVIQGVIGLTICQKRQHVQNCLSQFAESLKCGLSDNVALFRLFPAFHKFLLLLMKAAYFSVTGAGVGILQNALRNSTFLQRHVM